MSGDSELGSFLRGQRARVRPEDIGLTTGTHRRVPGLRREEVARLAGVSTDYYVRLEQGRVTPSEVTLTAIGRVLRLDEAGIAYLIAVGRPRRSGDRRRGRTVQRVREDLRELLDAWPDQPAYVIGRRTDVLAINPLGRALLTDFEARPANDRNYLRWLLLSPEARSLYRDWSQVGSDVTAILRADAGRYPDDPRTAELVGELAMKSEQFRQWWAEHRVLAYQHGVKRFRHPVVGDLDLRYQGLIVPGADDQTVFVYSAAPGSPSAEALQLLASWSAEEAHHPRENRNSTHHD
ncbi:helix-turn-helix domain-containing protein [Amycolatopsis sp. NPDC051903]|uniref:helix-turn-helix domain-containing protein n=1 Tax=Amycolatopsis sp. NPDC051903 TaxID=3363936 RepID=UPI003793A94D